MLTPEQIERRKRQADARQLALVFRGYYQLTPVQRVRVGLLIIYLTFKHCIGDWAAAHLPKMWKG